MTREEAIKVLRTESVELGGNAVSVCRFLEALDMAVKALEDVTDKNVGKNEPLTLDELRQMDGEPVWVQSPGVPEYGRWAIVEEVGENCLFLHDDFTCHDYGKTWLAYRQKLEEDNHDERKENENV